MIKFLTDLPPAPADPIFAIAQAAKAAGPDAIDGTVGVFLDENGKLGLFPSIEKAIADISTTVTRRSFGYPSLLGLPEYRTAVEKLVFGTDHGLHVATIATTGGTGALTISMRLLRLLDPAMILIAPVPTWANHRNIWKSAGMKEQEVPYIQNGKVSAENIVSAIEKSNGSAAVLLHASCHNPTGLDLTSADFMQIADACAAHNVIPLLDFAYQGFKSTPEEDRKVVEIFTDKGLLTLVCWSASKNHSVYSERAGLAAAVVPDADLKKKIEGHFQILTRGLHSAAATFGQSVVARVQEAYGEAWEEDLRAARKVMEQKRSGLTHMLPENFHASLRGYGMFAMLPLGKDQVLKLRADHKVFLTDDGRINIAGIPLKRIEELCRKISQVL